MHVVGYHGTSSHALQSIQQSGFRISRNEYDWLGDGVYFFQDAPERAWEWARLRFGLDAAVVGAEIDLQDCFLRLLTRLGLPLPRQTRGAHRLDRHVLNYTAGVLAEPGIRVRTVRAAFPEGDPVYPGSALLYHAHVQIAVRDPDVITRSWVDEGRCSHA